MTHHIQIAGSEVSFACGDAETVLDAALKAGIGLPHSCRKGVCGNCAAVVESGEFRLLPSAEVATGQVLLCRCVPLSDLRMTPGSWHRTDPAARKIFTAKVFRNTLVAPDISLLQLRLPAGQRARFKAGQYLQVELPDGSRRSYSMANAPHESDSLQLHIRHVPGGQFTQIVPTLKPGDLLKVELPFGSAELVAERAAPLLCVAGGTGFAPVKSLLDDLVKKSSKRAVTLVWGARDVSGLYLLSAVERWQRLLPGFRFVAALEDADLTADALKSLRLLCASNASGPEGGDWASAPDIVQGRVDEAILKRLDSLAGFEVYCCGSPPMVSAVRQLCLTQKGVQAADFFSDVFVPGPAAT